MRFGRIFYTAFLPVAIWLLFSARCYAQASDATVTGEVSDQSGKLVPSVTVVFTNINTGVPYTTHTNGDGTYILPALQPGIYRANVTRDGFKSIVKPDIELHVQDQVSINFVLQLGSVTETITVEGGAPIVNTESAAVSTVVDRQFVENMPLNGRSFQSLIALVPGVLLVPGGAVGDQGEFSVNGQRTEENYYTVDGVSANTGANSLDSMYSAGASGSVPGETALGTTQSLVSIDALQEFRIQTSSYSAEYGRTPGGQISLVTRSGTNDWHGSLFDYFRNDALDANNWFNNYNGFPRDKERQNDFGGTLGGPLSVPGLYQGKDRTFFFFSYEGLRLVVPHPAVKTLVPDIYLRTNAPPAVQPLLDVFPLPDNKTTSQMLPNDTTPSTASYSSPSTLDSISLRIDHSISDRFKLFGRFSDSPSASVKRGYASNNAVIGANHSAIETVTLGATNAFSPTLGNELRFNYTWNTTTFFSHADNFGGAQPLTAEQFLNGGTVPSFYRLAAYVDGIRVPYNLVRTQDKQQQLNVTDNLSVSHGAHNLRFGVDYRRLPIIGSDTLSSFYLQYFYFNESAVLQNNGSPTLIGPGPVVPEPVFTNFSAYAQDDWKATGRLSVSFGVRWEVNPAPGNLRGAPPANLNQITNLVTAVPAPPGTPVWQTRYRNFAPRLGLAYELRRAPGHETVLRAGMGLFYDTGNTNGAENFDGPGFVTFVVPPDSGFPLPPADLVVPPPSLATPYNAMFAAYDPHLRLPYTLQWNVAVEQALGANQALTFNYVGAGGRELLFSLFSAPAQLPQYGLFGLYLTTNGATSEYNSLQVQFQRRLSHGFQALASYTWSHSIDDASANFQDMNVLRGNSDFDVRNNFQAALTYQVPSGYANSVARAVLEHWGLDARISARSALPIDIIDGISFLPNGAFANLRPDVVPGQPIYVNSIPCASDPSQSCVPPGGRAVNINAFAPPAPTEANGNSPRNFVRGFGAWQTDLALRRDFPLHERLKLQFRAEAFNLFNHPNFGEILNDLSAYDATLFGTADKTLNNSLGGISTLYQMGGSRSLQLALKLVF
jgi:hypothetical protein